MKKLLGILALLVSFTGSAQKHIVDGAKSEQWESIEKTILSKDGRWIIYQVKPNRGEGTLYIYDLRNNRLDSIPRGENPIFFGNEKYLAVKQRDSFSNERKERLKIQLEMLPVGLTSTLILIELNASLNKKTFKKVRKFEAPKKASSILIWKDFENYLEPRRYHLLWYNMVSQKEKEIEEITSATIDEGGDQIAYVIREKKGDRLYSQKVKGKKKLHYKEQFIGDPKFGNKSLSFLFGKDQNQPKCGFAFLKEGNVTVLIDTNFQYKDSPYHVSSHYRKWYSNEWGKWFLEVLPYEKTFPDSLLKEEKVELDVWHWKDKQIQPEQLSNLSKELKNGYLISIDPNSKELRWIENEKLYKANHDRENPKQKTLGFSKRIANWEYPWKRSVYLIDWKKQNTIEILQEQSYSVSLSAEQKYLLYYKGMDSCWYALNLTTNKEVNLTGGIEDVFYKYINGQVFAPYPEGIAGWSSGDEYVYINSRNHIWKIDPNGINPPINLTQNKVEGNVQFRAIRPDKKSSLLPDEFLIQGVDQENWSEGVYQLKDDKLEIIVQGDFHFGSFQKAEKGTTWVLKRESFNTSPNLFCFNLENKKLAQISTTNKQLKEFKWANNQLVKWKDERGILHQGMLITPDDLDRNKKYPMLVYFYELYAERFNRFNLPRPSRSTIGWSEYASKDYIVFVPDVHYDKGHPGESAYKSILSGVDHVLKSFSFIDENNMGLQGQSWGGYQVAYLVTKTNRFKAAMAGAPVSNMFSAFGGIRWKSGLSRSFQYERSQSRIGDHIWNEHDLYIENSPLFHLPKVETPLLIMHNDHDGAVPWYQGIELYSGLRRLQKPVWMLNYNGDQHNLTRWAHRIDLNKKMNQFFDHYLKNSSSPKWLESGVKATEKNKVNEQR